MSSNFGIVMPYSGNIVDMIAIKSDGQIPRVKNGFPLAVSQGNVISIIYREVASRDIIEIYIDGTASGAYIQTKDAQGYGPGLGYYIVHLIIEF